MKKHSTSNTHLPRATPEDFKRIKKIIKEIEKLEKFNNALHLKYNLKKPRKKKISERWQDRVHRKMGL